MRLVKTLLFFALLIAISACQTRNQSDLQQAVDKVTPSADQGVLIGQVISTKTNQPLTNTIVRLAEILWNDKENLDGTYILNGATSPGAETDESGIFIFPDLKPADYVVVVGDLIGYNVIISNPDGKARVFTIDPNKTTQIEPLRVDLPK